MKEIKYLIEKNLVEHNDDDSYIITEEVKDILKRNGYKLVENHSEAEKYFKGKNINENDVPEISYRNFDIVDKQIVYNIKISKHFLKSNPNHFLLSVLITEL